VNRRRFLTPLFVRIAYPQDERQRAPPSPEDRSARAKAASHPVGRQPAQTSGVRKRVPFATGVITPL